MRRNLLTETEMLPLHYLKSFYQFIFVWRILLIITYYIDMCVCWCHWLVSSWSLITLEGVCDFKFVIKKKRKTLVYTRFDFLLYTTGTTTRIFWKTEYLHRHEYHMKLLEQEYRQLISIHWNTIYDDILGIARQANDI